MDLFKYTPIIRAALDEHWVRKDKREDLTQECFLALLEHEKELDAAKDDTAYAFVICRHRLWQTWAKETFGVKNFSSVKDKQPRFESLSDPKTFRRAAKIAAHTEDPDEDLLRDDLNTAVSTLPEEEREVIYRLFVLGLTQDQAAEDLGVAQSTVSERTKRGIKSLKKYFGED